MASLENLLMAASRLNESLSLDDAVKKLAQTVPAPVPFEHVEKVFSSVIARLGSRACIVALVACLQGQTTYTEEEKEIFAAARLATVLTKAVSPIHNSDDDMEDAKACYQLVADHSHPLAEPSMKALNLLSAQVPSWTPDNEVIITAIAFANEREAWTTSAAAALASDLIAQRFSRTPQQEPIFIETVLRDYLRPLFARSRPATVTASGRKAEYVDRERTSGLPDESQRTKPWKYQDLRAMPVFDWIVEAASESLVAQQWPMFVPVLLTLVDDPSTWVRARGLEILAAFLHKMPKQKLRETGLTNVFEQAVMPTLLYLPNTTPVDESLQLLGPAYAALLALAGPSSTERESMERDNLLDKILREGVFTAYSHAREHVRIVELLFGQIRTIVAMMGINSVKHLKDLIPMISVLMSDPFAPASPSTLLAATTALQAVIKSAWPRLHTAPWRDEIIQALVFAWLNVNESPGPAVDIIAPEIINTANLLAAVMKANGSSLATYAAPLVSKEPALAPLFDSLR